MSLAIRGVRHVVQIQFAGGGDSERAFHVCRRGVAADRLAVLRGVVGDPTGVGNGRQWGVAAKFQVAAVLIAELRFPRGVDVPASSVEEVAAIAAASFAASFGLRAICVPPILSIFTRIVQSADTFRGQWMIARTQLLVKQRLKAVKNCSRLATAP